MLRYNGYDLRFDPEGRLVEASNVATGVRTLQHYDDAGERRIALVYRTGKPVEVHRFIAPEYQIHDGEEVWLANGGSVQAEVVKSKGVLVDAYLLDELTAYVASGGTAKPKPLPAEYMDLNGDGQLMNAEDLAIALEGYQTETRVGGEKLVWKYTTSDHLGGASHTTDSTGDLIAHQRFHAYGKVASRKGQKLYRGGYIGKDTEPDPDLGLQRIGARYYAPGFGRWITPDPLIGQSPGKMLERVLESSLYSYAQNSPIGSLDPNGAETYTDSPNEVSATRSTSPMSPRGFAQRFAVPVRNEIAKALGIEPGEVDPRVVTMVLAQAGLETDYGAKMYNWNVGNHRTPGNSTSEPHFYLDNVREDFTTKKAADAALERNGGRGTGVVQERPGKEKPWAVYFKAGTPGARFASYESVADGIKAYLGTKVAAAAAKLQSSLGELDSKRLQDKDAVGVMAKVYDSELLGDPKTTKDDYHTASTESYQQALRIRYNQLAEHVNASLAEEDSSAKEKPVE